MPSDAPPAKLTQTEELILGLLSQQGEMYGLEMVHRADGLLARGTVYVVLDRMEAKGLVTSRSEPRQPGSSGITRRLYLPTAHGARIHRAFAKRRAAVLGLPVAAEG
jgi:DNA-binding PadR family transcriptional regulator